MTGETMTKLILAALTLAAVCSTAACRPDDDQGVQTAEQDPYLWLEEIEGEGALGWVQAQNDRTFERLTSDSRYPALLEEALADLTRSDRLPGTAFIGDRVYDLLRDKDHVRGLWRRSNIPAYLRGDPDWEPVLDFDALAEQDNQSWVFLGAVCVEPEADRCMLYLSRGGSDAAVLREFDLETKDFVEGGFELPEAKTSLAWANRNTLMVSTALDTAGSTDSGYGRQLRRWRRGTSFDDAPVVLEVEAGHVAVRPIMAMDGDDRHLLAADELTIFEADMWYFGDGVEPVRLPLPPEFEYYGVFDGRVFGRLRDKWSQDRRGFAQGDLVAFEIAAMIEDGALPAVDLLYSPMENQAIWAVRRIGFVVTRDALYFALLEDVVGRLARVTRSPDGWRSELVDLPGKGSVTVVGAHADSDTVIVRYEDFLTPPRLYAYRGDGSVAEVAALAPRFDSRGFETVQHFATSSDGTPIPYFVTRPTDLEPDGSAPALIGAYGGFGVAHKPSYLGGIFGGGLPFKTILRSGGSYVLANLRGGGEYGPRWHHAGILENRQRVFDDFYAVAEDLIARGFTSADHLGIVGASNSGLLVGVAFTQRPKLFRAVLCGVPLLDMRRYHKLLAGASWMAEYGDPDDPEMWDVIRRYSPYQNLRSDAEYPEVFFTSSTRDDRVHPGHARKMAAKMQANGQPFLYFENIEGGHNSAATLDQKARLDALQSVYLLQKLVGE
jgi:prolyl oligopeptidase